MTLQDLRDQGVCIQGAVKVKMYDYDNDFYIPVAETTSFNFYKLPDEYLNKEIKYIYNDDDYIVIEIEKE